MVGEYAGMAFCWASRFQQCRGTDFEEGQDARDLATSAAEAETYAASDCSREAKHYKYVCDELELEVSPDRMMQINIDASAAYGFIHNTGTVSRMKHIDMRCSWVQQLRNLAEVWFKRVDGTTNKADPFTKVLTGKAFRVWQETLMTPMTNVK